MSRDMSNGHEGRMGGWGAIEGEKVGDFVCTASVRHHTEERGRGDRHPCLWLSCLFGCCRRRCDWCGGIPSSPIPVEYGTYQVENVITHAAFSSCCYSICRLPAGNEIPRTMYACSAICRSIMRCQNGPPVLKGIRCKEHLGGASGVSHLRRAEGRDQKDNNKATALS